MKTKCMIIDDEERGIIALRQLLLDCSDEVEIVGEAVNIRDAEHIIRTSEPDVIFLDIEMPGGNGFQLLEKFDTPSFDVVFVSAYQEYALNAIKLSALDYLLKPVSPDELEAVFKRLKQKSNTRQMAQYELLKNLMVHEKPVSKIILSTSDGYYPVKLEDIIYCKAADNYTHFYLSGNKHHLISKTLREIEDMLGSHFFYRIHKSYLINLNHIEKINKTDGISVVMNDTTELPVSVRKRDEFIHLLNSL